MEMCDCVCACKIQLCVCLTYMCTYVSIDMCCHTPTMLLQFRDYMQCLYVLRNILISQEGCLLAARLTDNLRRGARKSAMRLKTQVSFPLSSFLPLSFSPSGIQLTSNVSWHSLPVCRMEMKKWMKKWENGARGARLGRGVVSKIFPINSTTYYLLFLCVVQKSKVERQKRVDGESVTKRKLHHSYKAKCCKNRLKQSCLSTKSFSLLCHVSPLVCYPPTQPYIQAYAWSRHMNHVYSNQHKHACFKNV